MPPIEEAPIDGVRVVTLRKFADERGWFCELRRESWYAELSGGRPSLQTNMSFSRAGVIRGLHWHRRGQDDLFFCPIGKGAGRAARSPRGLPDAGVAWSIDIDEDNCLAVYVPGQVAHGFEALTDSSSATTSPRSTTPPIPTSRTCAGTTRASWSCGRPGRHGLGRDA